MEYFLQISVNALVLSSLYALLALGFNFLYSSNKFFDLSYAAYLTIAVYLFISLSKILQSPITTSIIAIAITGLIATVNEKFLYKRLRAKKSSSAVMMIASLGLLTITQALIAILFTSNVQSLSSASSSVSVWGITFTAIQATLVIVTGIAYGLCYLLLSKTIFGRQLRAVADNEELALTSQLPISRIRIIAAFIAASCGATASILYGMDTSVDPYLGMQLLLKGVVVAILGGLGNITFGIIAALLLAGVETATIWFIGGEWKDAVTFLVLIIVLLFRPSGIFRS